MALELNHILITGSHGFIGKHVCSYLDKKNVSYISFSWDLREKDSIRDFFASHNISQIIHLVGTFEGDLDKQLELNFLTTKNLLEVALENNIRKIVYASTGAVYGEPLREESLESDSLFPHTPYGLSKKLAEELCFYFSRNHGFTSVVLRFPNVYGEWSRGVISLFQKQIQEKGKITLYGDGTQSRHFLYVDDAVEAIVLSSQYPSSDVFNITNPKKISLNELILEFKKYYKFEIEYIEENNNLLRDILLSPEKARNILGFEAKQMELLLR